MSKIANSTQETQKILPQWSQRAIKLRFTPSKSTLAGELLEDERIRRFLCALAFSSMVLVAAFSVRSVVSVLVAAMLLYILGFRVFQR